MGYALARSEFRRVARMTLDEFLAFEEQALERHHLVGGEVFEMTGSAYEECLITSNLTCQVGNALEGKRCRVLGTNLKVKLGPSEDLVYTDGLIVCGEPELLVHPRKRLVLLNPTVVFEVLSDSTRDFDRSEKFDGYRSIESLQEYVLIEQAVPRVDVFRRMGEGAAWKMTPYASLDAIVKLESVDIELTMRQIYEGVRFGLPPLNLIE